MPWWAAGLAGLTVLTLVVVLGIPALRGGDRAGAAGGSCRPTSTVRLVVSPDVAETVGGLLADPVAYGDQCTRGALRVVEPAQAVASLATLDSEALPELWIPDSSLWMARAGETALMNSGSFAVSPLVLGTSGEAAESLGWVGQAPTWAQAISSDRPLAVPDLIANAEGIAALAAVRASLGGDQKADNQVVQAAVAAARGEVPSAAEALAQAAGGGVDAPLVPLSERDVFVTNRARQESRLVAVYPADGSPFLDYPVVKVTSTAGTDPAAVDAVIGQLLSTEGREAARRAGFRDPGGVGPSADGDTTAGVQEPTPTALAMDPASIQAMLGRLTSLSKPSRVLSVYDVSTSMQATDGGRQTRIQLARDAAKSTLVVFPDQSRLGAWIFASKLDGDKDYLELLPTRPLTEDVGGKTQREALSEALGSLPNRLRSGGTSIYDTTLAATRYMRETYDPEAVNTLVIITDGKNEDSSGVQLDELLGLLAAEADPERPIQVVTIGLGPDADDAALTQIAQATGGGHFEADDPSDMQNVLFEMLRRRAG